MTLILPTCSRCQDRSPLQTRRISHELCFLFFEDHSLARTRLRTAFYLHGSCVESCGTNCALSGVKIRLSKRVRMAGYGEIAPFPLSARQILGSRLTGPFPFL